MPSVKTVEEKKLGAFAQKIEDYKLLVKLRLSLTVVFSSVMAYLIAATGPIDWRAIVILAIGGFLVTGAANTLNQVLEKDFDRLMKRTANRPLAAGRMSVSEAVMSAGFMSLIGISLLALFNPWTAFLGTIALMSYAFLYTPVKRVSPMAVVIGAIPGALPTLIGCAAAQGGITLLALILFTMQFLWQFPHFLSIGWLGHEDYSKAGYKLLHVDAHGAPHSVVGKQAVAYAAFLLPVSVLPYMLHYSGWVSMLVTLVLSIAYLAFARRFAVRRDRKSALQLMFFSFAYIPMVLIALFVDKF